MNVAFPGHLHIYYDPVRNSWERGWHITLFFCYSHLLVGLITDKGCMPGY